MEADLLHNLHFASAERGFDVFGVFSIADYNRRVAPANRLPTYSPSAAILGNTRNIWPHFIRAMAENPERIESSDPFDTWVEEQLGDIVARWDPLDVHYAHSSDSASRISMPQAAVAAGLGWISPSQLCVHPIYGPWVSWRAVIQWPEQLSDVERRSRPRATGPLVESPCASDGSCRIRCEARFRHAMNVTKPLTLEGVRTHWETWVSVRDCCSLGAEWRFSHEQLRYHYTADRECLRRCISA